MAAGLAQLLECLTTQQEVAALISWAASRLGNRA